MQHASPHPSRRAADPPADSPRLRVSPGALWVLFDLIVPTALFYVAIWMGLSLYWALLASAGLSAATAAVSWLRGDRRDSSVFMLLVAMLSLAIALVSGSDRFLLARESVITALAGCWFLWTVRADRPLTYRLTRPILQGRWGTTRDWEGLWAQDDGFRHIWRMTSVMWGVATLADAVLRVVIAYSMPIPWVPLMQTGLMVATMVLMQVVTNVYYIRAGLWPRLHAHAHGQRWTPGSRH